MKTFSLKKEQIKKNWLLIDAEKAGKINTRIKAVFSDRPKVPGIKRANRANIPTHCLTRSNFPNQAKYELELASHIDSYEPGLIVLAGFMKVLGAGFVSHFQGQIINIHPSLLPKYKGLNTHQRAIDNKEKYSGCTVHYVNSKLDSGKIILQKKVRILKNDTFKRLSKKILKHEHILYPKALNKVLSNL